MHEQGVRNYEVANMKSFHSISNGDYDSRYLVKKRPAWRIVISTCIGKSVFYIASTNAGVQCLYHYLPANKSVKTMVGKDPVGLIAPQLSLFNLSRIPLRALKNESVSS
jgi:hypothetical protein